MFFFRSSGSSFLRRGGSANSSFRKSSSNPPMNLWRPVVDSAGAPVSTLEVSASAVGNQLFMKARSSDSLHASPAAVHRYSGSPHSFHLQVPHDLSPRVHRYVGTIGERKKRTDPRPLSWEFWTPSPCMFTNSTCMEHNDNTLMKANVLFI